jgi:hypothetical protein
VDKLDYDQGSERETRKDPETKSGPHEEIDGDQMREVIVQQVAPGLRGRLARTQHVFADTALSDVNIEF